jgi:Flp pilus assembly protein TadG
MRRSGGDQAGDRGQATVEFALVLPLLAICIAGVIWVGQIVTMQIRLENAAREGARAAAVEPDRASSVAAEAVAQSMNEVVVSARLDGDYVVVEVATEIAGVPFVGVGARTITADAHMRREDTLND